MLSLIFIKSAIIFTLPLQKKLFKFLFKYEGGLIFKKLKGGSLDL